MWVLHHHHHVPACIRGRPWYVNTYDRTSETWPVFLSSGEFVQSIQVLIALLSSWNFQVKLDSCH